MESIADLPFVAGNVALDFVNTAEGRGQPGEDDALRVPADLRIWGERYDVLSRSARSDDERAELHRTIAVRELLYAIFHAQALKRRPARADLGRLATLVPPAYGAARLAADRDGQLTWSWSRSDLATVRHIAVTAAVELLVRTPAAPLKQCPGEDCGWFFLDTTKPGNRRWCSMSQCGQDAKVARRRTSRAAPARDDPKAS